MLPGFNHVDNVTMRDYNTYFDEINENMINRYTPELFINICYEQKINNEMVDRWYGCDMSKCIADSINFTKSCLSANQFELGGCEASSFGITIHDTDFARHVLDINVSFKNRPIIVTLLTEVDRGFSKYYAEIATNGIYKNGIRLFTGFIDNVEVNVDTLDVSITAYDIFNLFDKTDGSRIWNTMFPGTSSESMTVETAMQMVIDRITTIYRIPYSEPDIIRPFNMGNDWKQLFTGNVGGTWQSYVEIRNDSEPLLVADARISRNVIISKESQKVTIDNETQDQTTVTHKVNINMKNLDVEQIVQTVVKKHSTGEETTTSKTILAQLKEALPIPDPPEIGEPPVEQPTVITITEVDAEGNETVNSYDGIRYYDYNMPAIVEDEQGGHHISLVTCTIYIYQEAAKEHLLIQTTMQKEDTYDGEKETMSFSGNYISDKTSVREMLKAYCQVNGVFAFADAYGRIVIKPLKIPAYQLDSINLIVNDSYRESIPSGSMGVHYEDLTIGSNEGLTPIKQVVIRSSEKDPGYGRYPDQQWDTDEFGEYNGNENIVVIEGSIYIAEYDKNKKMELSHSLKNILDCLTSWSSLKPPPYSRTYLFGNNIMPKYTINGAIFNPFYEPGDAIYCVYRVNWFDNSPPSDLSIYDSFFVSFLLNMDISMSNGFKFNTQNDLEYDTHWLKLQASGFNLEEPDASGLSEGGGGYGGLAAFAVTEIPEHPRSNTIYFMVEED